MKGCASQTASNYRKLLLPELQSAWSNQMKETELLQSQAQKVLQSSDDLNVLLSIGRHFPFKDGKEPLRSLEPRIKWIREQTMQNETRETATSLLQCMFPGPTELPHWDFPLKEEMDVLARNILAHFCAISQHIHCVDWIRQAVGCRPCILTKLREYGSGIDRWLRNHYDAEQRSELAQVLLATTLNLCSNN